MGFIKRDDGVYMADYTVRDRYYDIVAAIARSVPLVIEDGYIIPHFAGMPFAYTKIDSVYIWTHDGYQIARGHDDYPIFIQIADQNIERWSAFFDEFGIPSTIEERLNATEHDATISYVLFPTTEGITREWVDGNPVIPLDETIDHMMKYRMNYEPALEMIVDEYDHDIDAFHENPRLNA